MDWIYIESRAAFIRLKHTIYWQYCLYGRDSIKWILQPHAYTTSVKSFCHLHGVQQRMPILPFAHSTDLGLWAYSGRAAISANYLYSSVIHHTYKNLQAVAVSHKSMKSKVCIHCHCPAADYHSACQAMMSPAIIRERICIDDPDCSKHHGTGWNEGCSAKSTMSWCSLMISNHDIKLWFNMTVECTFSVNLEVEESLENFPVRPSFHQKKT